MVGWHHRLNGHGFGWTPGVGDRQGGLACCGLWGSKSQTQLREWTELNWAASKSSLSLVKIMTSICYSSFIPPFAGIKCQNFIMNLQIDGASQVCGSGKDPSCQCRRQKRRSSILGLGRSLGVGNGKSLQYSCLENFMDRGVWWLQSMES